jgi:hypothetical protein
VVRANAVDRLPEPGTNPHLHEAGIFVLERSREAKKALAGCDKVLRLEQQPTTCGSQDDARARPLEERDADLLFQLTDMAAQRRL